MQRRLSKAQELIRMRLTRSRPVLARIGPWLRSQLRSAEQKFVTENQWSAHEEALALCTSQRLHQTVYFLSRDLAFMKEVSLRRFFHPGTQNHTKSISYSFHFRENQRYYENCVKTKSQREAFTGRHKYGYRVIG